MRLRTSSLPGLVRQSYFYSRESLPDTRQCPFKRRKRSSSTHYSDPTLACVSCVNSWRSSLPRENILACKCKNSVHSHLGVCEDSLDGVSQLKFSCTDAQRDSLHGGQFRNSKPHFRRGNDGWFGFDLSRRDVGCLRCNLQRII